MAERLDARVSLPSGMEEYLSYYGWHFSKKMCQWAVSRMYKGSKEDKEYIKPYSKEQLKELCERFGIEINSAVGYDAVYVANMCKADFLGHSIKDEQFLVMYVQDVIDDPDAYDGMVFTRFYADCIGSGTAIDWEDML